MASKPSDETSCRLCGNQRQLVRSHVIPELIYRSLYDGVGRAAAVREGADGAPKVWRIQKGERERLLCRSCERYLNDHFERPSAATWRHLTGQEAHPGIKAERVVDSRGQVGLKFTGIDYESFKLFLLSILWRSGVASSEQFSAVQLGPRHEADLRRRILTRDAGAAEDYPCLIGLGVGPLSDWGIMGPPGRFRWRGHRCYRFVLTRVVLTILVSSHFGRSGRQPAVLSPQGLLAGPVHLSELAELESAGRLLKAIPDELADRYGLD